MMETKNIVMKWFDKWEKGDFMDLPISGNFTHTSPFGTIEGKTEYLNLVKSNREKFLGHQFMIHDMIFKGEKACVRYTAVQGDFKLDVSEWYRVSNGLIDTIHSYYHIGEIAEGRELKMGN
jgi:hypothetical protein